MATAKPGDTVEIHYRGILADGTEFDSSRHHGPLKFKVGDGEMLPDFEDAILGMSEGEQKTFTIPCESAYGEHDAGMNLTVPRDSIPEDIELAVGTILRAQGPQGETASFTVLAIEDDNVVMDGNHPLAGHDLTFELELVQVS